ncbi:MAG: anthranilate phosphoribosyltransferase [Kiritimatiellae bacterium]|nr:anthranilate phosphoribosyltransferase [Kiritimatiellia bacterium]
MPDDIDIRKYLQKIIDRHDLSADETSSVFDLIMDGRLTGAQIAALISVLRMKGESADEIAGAASAMRRHAVKIDTGGLAVVDTCGTGGDGGNTFNISTTAAFVVAGAGVPVAKHGNRAVSSQCGSADVLAELGVNLEAPPEAIEECIRTIGIGFLFAPKMHPAMKHAAPVRRELGIRTIFNMLGPLTNPANARGQILGVFSAELTEPFARVLAALGSRRAFIVHGNDGLDEITVTTTTRITELNNGRISTYEFDPLPFIGEYFPAGTLAGGDPAKNAAILRCVLAGEEGPAREIVLLNAAAGIAAGGHAETIEKGYLLARKSIDEGRAQKALDAMRENLA